MSAPLKAYLKDFLSKNLDNRDQDFAEASIELLILAMYADGEMAMAEREFLDEYGSQLRWQGRATLDVFLSLAYGRVRQVHVSKQRVTFMRTIAEKLPRVEDRLELFTACLTMLKSDGKAAAGEREFLADLKTGFSLK